MKSVPVHGPGGTRRAAPERGVRNAGAQLQTAVPVGKAIDATATGAAGTLFTSGVARGGSGVHVAGPPGAARIEGWPPA